MRIDQITFTRFIAAVLIVVFHFGKNVFPFNVPAFSSLFEQANVGVSYFFLLSGFVMIIAYGNQEKVSPVKYYQNRFGRIYPVYFLAIVLWFVWHLVAIQPINYASILCDSLAIQSWILNTSYQFNYPGWSICVEMLFYLLFPVLLNSIYRRIQFKYIFFGSLIIWFLTQLFLNIRTSPLFNNGVYVIPGHTMYFPLMHLNEFLIGNVAGLFFLKKFKNYKRKLDMPVLICLVGAILALKYSFGLNYHNGLLAIFFIPMIVFMAINNGILTRIMEHKSLVFLGEASYGIYILQYPVFYFVNYALVSVGLYDDFAIFYISLAALILVSSFSYKYFETPLRVRIRSIKLG